MPQDDHRKRAKDALDRYYRERGKTDMTESQNAQRVTDWKRLYVETAHLSRDWRANFLFNEGCQDLTDRLQEMTTDGTAKPAQIRRMAAEVRELCNAQLQWLQREEAAVIEELEASIN